MSDVWDGRPGTAKDGTPVVWVASLNRAVPVATAKQYGVTPRPQPPGPGGARGFDAASDSQKFQDRIAIKRADADVARMTAASDGAREGYQTEQDAIATRKLIDKTPTGPASGFRIGAGRLVGKYLGVLPGVPTPEETTNLENFRTMSSKGVLPNTQFLKGPLSDKDVAFLKQLSYSPDATRGHNRSVAEAQRWAAKRQEAYEAALRGWVKSTGSPSALNGLGQSFDQFWGKWSAEKLPRPDLVPTSPRAKANAQLKAKSAASGGYRVLGTE